MKNPISADHPKVWQHILKSAGVHLYNDSGDIVYSGNGVLSIHTKDGGRKTITLKNGKTININTKANITLILDQSTGEILMGDDSR